MALSMTNLPVGIGAVGLAVAVFYYYRKLTGEPKSVASIQAAKPKDTVEKNDGPKIEVYYGSQTGTAEEFSKILAQEGRKHGFQMKSVDLEKFDAAKLKGSTSIFLVATYGEGDPTDNARSFHRWLSETAEEGDLAGMQFTVFALGNMQYEHYNSFGKLVDKECERCEHFLLISSACCFAISFVFFLSPHLFEFNVSSSRYSLGHSK
jgi:NADPH-ferrihemoprotein reductase